MNGMLETATTRQEAAAILLTIRSMLLAGTLAL